MLSLLVATQWTACGGKAVVDGASSQGGAGGASTNTNTSTSTNTGPAPVSSSSGGSCSCNVSCNYLQDCGFFGPECLTLCMQSNDPAFFQCACGSQGDCGTISTLCGIGSTSTGVTGSTGSGGGGLLTASCISCMQGQVDNDACTMEVEACVNDGQCQNLINCAANCGFTQSCVSQCEATYPGGIPGSALMMGCLLCGSCLPSCASTYASQHYCSGSL